MAETVKVIVRCRPMNSREKGLKSKNCVFMDPKRMQCSMVNVNDQGAPAKNFTFDGVYDTKSTTENIYNEIAYPLVEGVLEGYNGTVFAYGQTGCGKSYTMQGVKDPQTQRGIIPRSFEHIFEAIDASENMKYLVHASYLEIYNEEIRDLLGKDTKKSLPLKESPDKGVYVSEISMHPVHNTAECEKLMDYGWSHRSVGSTKMNDESSRSHSIFTINVEMMDTGGDDGGQHIRRGKLNLVDLAGSERQSKTEATGDRLKEANKINLSLSALGNVISALVDGKKKHIPYRDSKLTRLLQDSLGGNTKTMMVACLSPADNNYDETLSTLRYANRAKNIKNKPKINEDPKDAMLREYQEEIQRLKAMLDGQPQTGAAPAAGGIDPAVSEALLEEERQRMRKQHDQEMEEMRKKMESEKQSKAKMQAEIEAMRRQHEDKVREMMEKRRSSEAASTAAAAAAVATGGRAVTGRNGARVMSRQASIAENGPMGAAATAGGSKQQQQQQQPISKVQQEAMAKLKKLQEEMIDGGRRAGDRNLRERRKQKKRAAEDRIKALGEALGHVDDEDGVLIKVYDDIQEELRVKTDALKKSKQKVKAMATEIQDLQQEFEYDRSDYLDTIRDQERKLALLEQIMDRVQPMIRKDCNYSNLAKIQGEAVWNDETQRWRIPELVMQKTKLPPASTSQLNSNGSTSRLASRGKTAAAIAASMLFARNKAAANGGGGGGGGGAGGGSGGEGGGGDGSDSDADMDVEEVTASTAANTDDNHEEEEEDDYNDHQLQKKLAKSEEEDIAGTYFKPQRANRIMAQAQETKKNGGLSKPSSTTSTSLSASNLVSNSNLSSSFNSGLNTFGLNNSYTGNNMNGGSNGVGAFGNGGGGGGGAGGGRGGGGGLGGGGGGGGGISGAGSWGGPSSMGLSNGGGGGGGGPSSYASDLNNFRKPSRLEALPVVDHRGGGGGGGGGPKAHGNGRRKGGGGGFGGGGGAGGPILNTMGTF